MATGGNGGNTETGTSSEDVQVYKACIQHQPGASCCTLLIDRVFQLVAKLQGLEMQLKIM